MPDLSETLKKRIVYALPNMDHVPVRRDLTYKTVGGLELKADVYYPFDVREGDARPAVIFIHGEAPPEILKNAKDWGQYVSWGQLAAASGLIAVTFNHRSSEWFSKLPEVASDVDDLLAYVRRNAAELGIDRERLGVWTCSGGTPVGLRAAIRASATGVRCMGVYYGRTNLELLRETDNAPDAPEEVLREFSPEHHFLQADPASLAPLLIARAGKEALPGVNESIDRFVRLALAHNAAIEVINHPDGEHGFDFRNDDARSREIIRRTLAFMQQSLK